MHFSIYVVYWVSSVMQTRQDIEKRFLPLKCVNMHRYRSITIYHICTYLLGGGVQSWYNVSFCNLRSLHSPTRKLQSQYSLRKALQTILKGVAVDPYLKIL